MSGSDRKTEATPRPRAQVRLYVAGVFVLVASLIAAIIIYLAAPPQDLAALQYGATDDPRYQAELMRIGGQANVLMTQFHDWFVGLWHGTTLAYTVAILGIVAAAACFLLGHLLGFDAPDDHDGHDGHEDSPLHRPNGDDPPER